MSTDPGRPALRRPIPRVLGALAFLLALGMDAQGGGGCGPPLPPGVSSITVGAGHGFGGATIYYPTAAARPYGGVAAVPAYGAGRSTIAWYGPLLAAEGFVVINIDTLSRNDDPTARGEQLLAALDYLAGESAVRGIVDGERLAVLGWSMGGGGALEASAARPELLASVPLAPWNDWKDFSDVTVPTLVFACQDDAIAPISTHAIPMYESVSPAVPKLYVELAGQDHFCVTTESDLVGDLVIAWMRRFVDGDPAASAELCPPPAVGGAVSGSASSCPF